MTLRCKYADSTDLSQKVSQFCCAIIYRSYKSFMSDSECASRHTVGCKCGCECGYEYKCKCKCWYEYGCKHLGIQYKAVTVNV